MAGTAVVLLTDLGKIQSLHERLRFLFMKRKTKPLRPHCDRTIAETQNRSQTAARLKATLHSAILRF